MPLNLQATLNDVYDRSGYGRRMNYTLPPAPPIPDNRLEWLKGFLQTPTH